MQHNLKTGQNALIQSKDFEQAVILMGDTIEYMDIEIQQEVSKM